MNTLHCPSCEGPLSGMYWDRVRICMFCSKRYDEDEIDENPQRFGASRGRA